MNRLGLLAIFILAFHVLALLDLRLSRLQFSHYHQLGRCLPVNVHSSLFRPTLTRRDHVRDHFFDDYNYYSYKRRENHCYYSTVFSCVENSESEAPTTEQEEKEKTTLIERNGPTTKPPTNNKSRQQQRGWAYRMQQLQAFYQVFAHTQVTSETGRNYPGLYQWVRTIRGGRRRSKLSLQQLQELESVEFCWSPHELAWRTEYTRLQRFYGEYGHCRVPNNSKEYAGLGVWVRNQRREHQYWLDGVKSTLSIERRQLLESIDFQWYRPHEVVWQERYDQLCQFVQDHGHANIPQTDQHLGIWCMNQRTAYRKYQRGEPTAMTEERIAKLQAVGFSFFVRRKRWEIMVGRLCEYHTRNGHVNIATNDTRNRDLRLWLITQRFRYNQKLLPPDRIHSIEDAIPDFEWFARNKSGPSQKDWTKLFEAMREKGISPEMPAKQHWFQGAPMMTNEVKDSWTPEELLALWNEEDDEDDDDAPYRA